MSLKQRLDGAAAVLVGAALFAVIGTFFLVLALTSSTAVQWTGSSVHGTEEGGIVYYSVDGRNYSLDDTSRFLSHTVYFDPHDPADTAMLGSPVDRAVDVVSVGAPYGLAVGISGFAAVRRRRRRRERERRAAGEKVPFGRGLDDDVVQRLLDQQRQGPPVARG